MNQIVRFFYFLTIFLSINQPLNAALPSDKLYLVPPTLKPYLVSALLTPTPARTVPIHSLYQVQRAIKSVQRKGLRSKLNVCTTLISLVCSGIATYRHSDSLLAIITASLLVGCMICLTEDIKIHIKTRRQIDQETDTILHNWTKWWAEFFSNQDLWNMYLSSKDSKHDLDPNLVLELYTRKDMQHHEQRMFNRLLEIKTLNRIV
jgi:hypothetical protein